MVFLDICSNSDMLDYAVSVGNKSQALLILPWVLSTFVIKGSVNF